MACFVQIRPHSDWPAFASKFRPEACQMNITRTLGGGPFGGWWRAVILLAGLIVPQLSAADIELAVLRSGTDVFTNVIVYGQTQTDLFIKHARGFGNVKVSTLDEATLRELHLGGSAAEKTTTSAVSDKATAAVATLKAKLEASSPWKIPAEEDVMGAISHLRPSRNVMVGAVAAVGIIYLLWCACLKLICVNAGSKAGFMIWIPVLQMFPLLRAAQMSAWWFVAFLIPLVGVVAHIVWCVKISRACGKGMLVALLLILPVTNLLAFLYLAVSTGKSAAKPEERAESLQRHVMVLGEA
jgi:hypothetical protein